jgi:hypothetical protein
MAMIGSFALILFYILTRTINIPSIGIQDDIGATDIFTKVMQAAIIALSAYIVISIMKRKSQISVPIYEYEER